MIALPAPGGTAFIDPDAVVAIVPVFGSNGCRVVLAGGVIIDLEGSPREVLQAVRSAEMNPRSTMMGFR